MFKTITETLTPYLGFYIYQNKRLPAITRSFAINTPVVGLSVVVGDSNRESKRYKNCQTDYYTTQVFLTQHEGGVGDSIDQAVDALTSVGYETSIKWLLDSRQANIRKAVVTISTTCIC